MQQSALDTIRGYLLAMECFAPCNLWCHKLWHHKDIDVFLIKFCEFYGLPLWVFVFAFKACELAKETIHFEMQIHLSVVWSMTCSFILLWVPVGCYFPYED